MRCMRWPSFTVLLGILNFAGASADATPITTCPAASPSTVAVICFDDLSDGPPHCPHQHTGSPN
jgi:hypothetical protein